MPNDEFPNIKYNLYFRLPYPSTNENLALITRYSVNDDNYEAQVCGYKKYPTDEELKKGPDDGYCSLITSDHKIKEGIYTKFIYLIDFLLNLHI